MAAGVALAGAHGGEHAAAVDEAAKPRTLVTVGELSGFAQDGNRIVWADYSQRCTRKVQLRDLRTGRTTPLLRANGPTCRYQEGRFQERMALSGTRALWGAVRYSHQSDHTLVATAAPGSPERQLAQIVTRGGIEDEDLYRPVPMAGDAGTLLFADNSNNEETYGAGAYRVTATGAAVLVGGTLQTRALTAAGTRFGLARYEDPGWVSSVGLQWSPDGTKVFYRGHERRGSGPLTLHAVDVATGADAESFSPVGWLDAERAVALRAGGAVAVVEASGAVVRELIGQSEAQTTWWWTLSPDRRLLAYTARTGTGHEIRIVDVATGARRTLAHDTYADGLAWLGDGSGLVYARGYGEEIRHVGLGGGPPATLASKAEQFAASPTEPAVAVRREASGIEVVDASGRSRPVVKERAHLHGWSPDGRMLVYTRNRPGGYALRVVRADGTDDRLISDIISDDPLGWTASTAWSPDSSALAFDAGLEIRVAAVDGTRLAVIPHAVEPTWSPDGLRIAYTIVGAPGEGEVAIANADGTGARTLTHTVPEPEGNPVEIRRWPGAPLLSSFDAGVRVEALALGGDRLALLVRDGAARRIELRRPDGALVHRVAVPTTVELELSMSGRWIVYRVGRTIKAVDARSGRTTTLTVAQGRVVGLSIDGRRVAWGEQRPGRDRIRALTVPA